jgi:hypothetical protein
MSECPVDQPTDEVLRPLPLPAGHSPLTTTTDDPQSEDPEARFQAFVAKVRERALAYDKHGMLGRFDEEEDHNNGSLLYDAVVFQDTAQLTDSGWLDRIEAISRLEARLAALKAESIAGFDDSVHGVSADLGHRHPEPGDRAATAGERRWHAGDLRSVSDEVGLALDLHRAAATHRIHTSCELTHNFPATLHALTEGALTERAAFTIVLELSVLDDVDELRAAEEAVLQWARKNPLQRIKQAARKEAARRNPAATDKAHKKARAERSVRMVPSDFGTADLIHNQDAADAAAVMTSLSRAAAHRRRQGDPRSWDQLRSDIALARLLPRTKTATESVGGSGKACGETTRSNVAADAPAPDDAGAAADASALADDGDPDGAMVGADATVLIHATGAEVRALLDGEESTGGEVDGHGPIPQNSLRKHLIKALAQTLLPNLPTTPVKSRRNGLSLQRSRIDLRVIDEPPVGDPDKYTPSAEVNRYVRQRDRICRFPGCNRPAEFTDVDHRVAFAAGGRTTVENLHCLCRHHHRLKHEGSWDVRPNADGSYTWTSPTGRRYREEAPDPGPDP